MATIGFFILYFLPTIWVLFRKRPVIKIFIINLFVGWTIIGWIAAFVLADSRSKGLTSGEKVEKAKAAAIRLSILQEQRRISAFGELKPKVICPHCQKAGAVYFKSGRATTGLSGGKIVASSLTMGLTAIIPGIGLSGRKLVNISHCENCDMDWQIDRRG